MESERIKVLLVEGNPAHAFLATEALRNACGETFDIEHADGLARGLEHLSKQRFDVVLLNPALPDAQGADAIAQVHEQAPGVPIILQTPADTDMLAAAALQFGDVDGIINGGIGRRLLASSMIHAVKRRRAEEDLKASRESFQAIVAKSVDGLLVVDKGGAVQYVNPSAETQMGCTAEELLGRTFAFPLVTGASAEVPIVREHGELGAADMQVVETLWHGQEAYLVLLHDITERKRLDAELARAKAAAEAANQAKTEFLVNMRQELRAALESIIGLSKGLLDRADRHPLNEHQKDRIAKILLSGRHLLLLVNNALDISKIEAGEAEIHVTTFDVLRLAAEVGAVAETMTKGKPDVAFCVKAQPGLLPLTSDRDKVSQVLLNLISNAVRLTERGSVTLRIERQGGCVRMDVESPDIGGFEGGRGAISDDDRPGAPGREPSPGDRLGFSVARSLAELLGGTLTQTGADGRGSTFSLVLPMALETGGTKDLIERGHETACASAGERQ